MELRELSLTAGNYLLSQTASNCGDMPEVKDSFFTTYYAFNRIVLDVLMEKFDIQVDDNTVTQLMLLHSDIPGYDLPAIGFVSPLEEAQESHILEEEDFTIYAHLEKLTQSVQYSPSLYNKSPRRRSNSQRFRGYRTNANYHTIHIIHCMCDCSYYNIISDL